MYPFKVIIFIVACFILSGVDPVFGRQGKLSSWVAELLPVGDIYKDFDNDNNAIILMRERSDSYDESGKRRSYYRIAVHLKSKEERSFGSTSIYLPNSSSKLKSFSAWIVYPSGKIESFGKGDLVSVAADSDQLYGEARYMILDRAASMRDDTLYACQYEVEEDSSILESFYFFQESVPVLKSRYDLMVPEDWRVKVVPLNGGDIAHQRKDGVFVWEGKHLAPIKDEPGRPPLFAVSAMLGISVYPNDKDAGRSNLEMFDSWQAVANYVANTQNEGLVSSSDLEQMVSEITAGKESEWGKIKAICEFAQSVNYVAAGMNLAEGGGYIPRPASMVFEKRFGDCKDMTALARVMLDVAGIRSYAVIARIGDEEYVHDEWSSPLQFNHCILAVEIGEKEEASAIVDDAQFGRLLFFDPTAKSTLFGWLPSSLQDTQVLIGDQRTTELRRLPISSPENNNTTREVSMTLSDDGSVSGSIHEINRGSGADYMRSLIRRLSDRDLDEQLQAWVAKGMPNCKISGVTIRDDEERNEVTLDMEFETLHYARRLGADKLIVRPIFLERREWVPPTDKERTTDYQFSPWSLAETVEVELPVGFSVESIRDSFSGETDFYTYSLTSEHEGNRLKVLRNRSSNNIRVKKEDYPVIVEFFENMVRMESAPVVAGRLVSR